MSKRFTATEKWVDPWFCSLTPINKLFWIYLLDNCDHAGIWQVNWPLVKFHIWEEVIDHTLFGNRIVVITSQKWFIPKFLEFQYGELNPENKVHSSVLRLLEREGVDFKGLDSPIDGAKDKEKAKDKDVVGKYKVSEFVMMTQGQYDQLAQKFGKTVLNEYVERLNHYIGSKGKRYKSHYHTILSWTLKDKVKPLKKEEPKPLPPDPKQQEEVARMIKQTMQEMANK